MEWINGLDLLNGMDGGEILDDQERYLKMALKLEPKNPIFLARNENEFFRNVP